MNNPIANSGASTDFIKEVEDLENVIFVCFGRPSDYDLPQVADEDSIIVDLLQHMSGKSHALVEAEIHHQIDGSYQ
jgi:hypothetical protein